VSWADAKTKFAGLEIIDVMSVLDFKKLVAVPDETRSLPVHTKVGRSWPGYENENEEERCRRAGLFRGESLAPATPINLRMCDAFKMASTNMSITFCACAWTEPTHELWIVKASIKSCQLIVRMDKEVHVGSQIVVEDSSGIQHALTCPHLDLYLWYRTSTNLLCLNASMEGTLNEINLRAGITKTVGHSWSTSMDRFTVIPHGLSLHVRDKHHVTLPSHDCTQSGHPYFPDSCQIIGVLEHHYNASIGVINLGV
jgi:hypothetical protein